MRVEPRVIPLDRRHDEARDRALLRVALAGARRFLPSQPPLERFIHHNPLHGVEHLPFEEAVVLAARTLGAEPYPSERTFGRFLQSGRIHPDDIADVLGEIDLPEDVALPRGLTRRALRMTRLLHPLEAMDPASIRFAVEEGLVFRAFHPAADAEARARIVGSAPASETSHVLERLHSVLAAHAPARPPESRGARPRDRVLAEYGEDVDDRIHPILFRLCAVFLDRGVAGATPLGREEGLLHVFRELHAREGMASRSWLEGVAHRLEEHPDDDADALAIRALHRMGICSEAWGEVVERALVPIRGWAGMITALEARADGPRLADLLAIALVLEAEAVAHVERTRRRRAVEPRPRTDDVVAREAFVFAQILGLGPEDFQTADLARAFVDEVAAFSDVERRRIWFLAYERHHRNEVLDAIARHAREPATALSPTAQVVFCIDEREESMRRHLEEVDPRVETLGYAGFFGVAMDYQGLGERRPVALCPAGIHPGHLVIEEPVERARVRVSPLAALRRLVVGGTRELVRGGIVSAVLGLFMLLPLVLRVVAPLRLARLARALEPPRPKTRLHVEHGAHDARGVGFEVEEMADVVATFLRTTGLAERLAPVVAVLGHGSSSLNNPHEAAYNCGAAGGGHGGPNARAFAAMANHPGVRAELARRGTGVPDGVLFIGGCHDTCDDAIAFYDLDLVPASHAAAVDELRSALDHARRRSAHERCRRFESAPLELELGDALAHVERRAASFAEPRPECGHVTNALCVVGPRALTRGLFLDRRAFLVSYDPSSDEECSILAPLLATVLNVCGGISLEYYFSYVDAASYGCGTKVAHNVASLIGVMDGSASDLRTGLPVQMVELHEPMRLLVLIEVDPERFSRLLERDESTRRVVANEWVRVVARRPADGALFTMSGGRFVPYVPTPRAIPEVESSSSHYRGERDHLAVARVATEAGG
jgi:uncharacterized protein